MEAAKQEIEQTGGVRCLGRQSESRDRGEHKRGTAFQWFTATQRHGNTPRLNRFQTTIQLDNNADGRFVPRISLKYRKSFTTLWKADRLARAHLWLWQRKA
jgi:hypothetical protein